MGDDVSYSANGWAVSATGDEGGRYHVTASRSGIRVSRMVDIDPRLLTSANPQAIIRSEIEPAVRRMTRG